MTDLTGYDRVTVARKVESKEDADFEQGGVLYEELEVFNHASVEQRHYVNGVNGHETFEPRIYKGNSMDGPPEYITKRLAEYLWMQFDIEVDSLDADIEVVDCQSDDVEML